MKNSLDRLEPRLFKLDSPDACELLQAALDESGDMIYLLDRDSGRFVNVNGTTCQVPYNGGVRLEVSDDGVGFDRSSPRARATGCAIWCPVHARSPQTSILSPRPAKVRVS